VNYLSESETEVALVDHQPDIDPVAPMGGKQKVLSAHGL